MEGPSPRRNHGARFSVDNFYWQVLRVQNGDKSRGMGKEVGHGSLPPSEDPVTRPVGWEHLTVATLEPPFEEQAPRQRDPYNMGEGSNTPEGAWAVSPLAAWLITRAP